MRLDKTWFGIIVLGIIVLSLVGCGGGSGGPAVRFHEDFESYSAPLNPWAPAGWQIYGGTTSTVWEVVSDGGNHVLRNTTLYSAALYNNYTGTDYTVSVRFKPVSSTANLGISVRSDGSRRYFLMIQNPGVLALIKYPGAVSGTAVATTLYGIDGTRFYTLTLSVSGNVLTGTITDGTTTATVTFTDDGMTYGPVIADGKGSLEAYEIGSEFDDFMITEP